VSSAFAKIAKKGKCWPSEPRWNSGDQTVFKQRPTGPAALQGVFNNTSAPPGYMDAVHCHVKPYRWPSPLILQNCCCRSHPLYARIRLSSVQVYGYNACNYNCCLENWVASRSPSRSPPPSPMHAAAAQCCCPL